ncbi:hypothetical protein ABNQ39_20690 [Azospirillum sp. A26]|uniref:hypothetical protein n=1 Tax=Azospirillum sp. A26 TaxID=3160607 RepID=UPI003671D690
MTADPHPAALTPEQMAKQIVHDRWRPELAMGAPEYLSSRCAGALRDAIANAIRSAVMAERTRCVDAAKGRMIEHLPTVFAQRNEVCQEVIAAILSGETDHDR